ncbi:Serine/threonine-protein phosphatase 7 long form-like protein [Senna tora]|uniref:Serine/threonine-protein phosphatase 7 long form-like protein n=1 Tax=Senna tora TaxID=362788 RepID=A0A834SEJ2_9FABA|nr:Serine/threonine-protein phosphatase 7 long form-like protein [Senna tora]
MEAGGSANSQSSYLLASDVLKVQVRRLLGYTLPHAILPHDPICLLLLKARPSYICAIYDLFPVNGVAQLDGHVLESDRRLPNADDHMKSVGLRPPPHNQGRYHVLVVWEEVGYRRSVKTGRYQERNKYWWRVIVRCGLCSLRMNCRRILKKKTQRSVNNHPIQNR